MSELGDVVARLISADIADEALGVWRPEKRILGFVRPPALMPVGRAWRLGVLLLARDGTLYATGMLTRAIVPKDFNSDKSIAGEQRRDIQRAAARGSFRAGDSVNYEWRPLDPQSPELPLSFVDGVLHVTDGATVPLEAYLADRIALLD